MVDKSTEMAPLIPLDPTKWEEPKEQFTGRLVECKPWDTDQSKTSPDHGEVTFTEYLHLPRPKRQWRVVIERLDAVYKNKETGETYPIRRYMVIDLERYNEQSQSWSAMPKGQNKPYFTLEKWAAAKLQLHPDPTKLEGLVANWEYLRSKMFGGNNAAKDIIYPLQVLALPNTPYEYRGEVLEIEFTPKDGQGVSLDDSAAGQQVSSSGSGGGASSPSLTKDAVVQMLAEAGITDGSNDDAIATFVKEHKDELPSNFKMELVTGEFFA